MRFEIEDGFKLKITKDGSCAHEKGKVIINDVC